MQEQPERYLKYCTPLIQPAELAPLMQLTGDSHPFAYDIDLVLSGQTQLGSALQPLFRRFNELSSRGALTEPRVCVESFEAVHGFLKTADLGGVELSRSDLIFLTSNRSGN